MRTRREFLAASAPAAPAVVPAAIAASPEAPRRSITIPILEGRPPLPKADDPLEHQLAVLFARVGGPEAVAVELTHGADFRNEDDRNVSQEEYERENECLARLRDDLWRRYFGL